MLNCLLMNFSRPKPKPTSDYWVSGNITHVSKHWS